MTTEYPWDGKVVHRAAASKATANFALRLRVPGWCQGATAAVGGEKVARPTIDRGYLVLDREWKTGDARRAGPADARRAGRGQPEREGRPRPARHPARARWSIASRPCDQAEPLASLYLPPGAKLEAEKRSRPARRRGRREGNGRSRPRTRTGRSTLYQPAAPRRRWPITAIPYYAWDNRKPGAMKVWLPVAPPMPAAGGPETRAKVSLSFVSGNCQPWGINDGKEPSDSNEQPAALCHWWPHHGGEEWAQYTWKNPVTRHGRRRSTGSTTPAAAPAGCRPRGTSSTATGPPGSPSRPRPTTPSQDRWCRVSFAPVKTTGLRLALRIQPEWAAGVHEWKVGPLDED